MPALPEEKQNTTWNSGQLKNQFSTPLYKRQSQHQLLIYSSSHIPLTLLTLPCHLLYIHPRYSCTKQRVDPTRTIVFLPILCTDRPFKTTSPRPVFGYLNATVSKPFIMDRTVRKESPMNLIYYLVRRPLSYTSKVCWSSVRWRGHATKGWLNDLMTPKWAYPTPKLLCKSGHQMCCITGQLHAIWSQSTLQMLTNTKV